MIHELRHYVAADGRSAELVDRFRRYTLPIFRELGFEVCHVWQEAERSDHIWYLLAWHSEEAMEQGWARLRAHAQWQEIKARTEADGPLIDRIRSRVLRAPVARL